MRFKDKVVVVTGGASGQGAAACQMFAGEGARVIVADWNGEGAAQVAAEIGAVPFTADVSKEADVAAMLALAVDRFGRLDVLFNNAGVGYSETARFKMASIVDTPEAAFDAIIAINLKGQAMGCKHAIPHMLRSGGGAIVNNASVMAIKGLPGADAYTAAKGGIIALTRALAVDWAARGIRVNCICPGTIDTPMPALKDAAARAAAAAMAPMRRIGHSEEVAHLALFLASDHASYITGAIIPVDGGMWAA